MATYVYKSADGSLYSWSPNDGGQVADAATLSANGLAVVSGLAALDASHAWDPASKSVIAVTPAANPQPLLTGIWILRFTPAEFAAIDASTDATVRQFMYALNHTTQIDLSTQQMVNGVNYLISVNLLQSSRVAAIMAVPVTVNGP